MIKVLIVDDESYISLHLNFLVKSLGFEVVDEATSGQEAVEKAQSLKPDVVLMDIGLKGNMDGIEAAQQILKGSNIPVVYVTGNSDTLKMEKAKAANPYGYVMKPVEKEELHSAIDMAINIHKADCLLRERLQQKIG
jgi:DNA-binding NarL/FixJ family response regulator